MEKNQQKSPTSLTKPSRPNEILRFDIEANGYCELHIDRKGNVTREANKVWCMWIQDLYDGSMTGYRGDSIIEGVRRLWSAKQIRGHNIIQYDIPVLQRVTGLMKPDTVGVDDSLIRLRVLYPEPGVNPFGGLDLDAMGEWLVSQGKLAKGKGKFHGPWDRWSQEMDDYCRQDVVVHEAIDEYLSTIPQNEMVVQIEHKVTQIIARQTANGWTFDREAARKMIAEFDIRRAELRDALNAAFPPKVETLKTPEYYKVVSKTGKVLLQAPTKGECERRLKALLDAKGIKRSQFTGTIEPGPLRTKIHPFNPGSTDQIIERLREKYGWQPKEMTNAGNFKCDYDVLVKLDYPEVKLLLDYADVDKMLEMLADYERRAAQSRDGKIHGTINVQGCVTGRMSHNQPNMGNVPKPQKDKAGNYIGVGWKIRTLFKPRPGWKEIGVDASALEDRMLRNQMGRFDPKEWTLPKEDLHTMNMNILAKVVPTITRDNAKTFWYGILYGAGDAKAGKIVGKGADVGKRMKDIFFADRPALGKLIEWCKGQARNLGKIQLLDTRWVPCRSEHSALNTKLQGDGACVMKLALIILDITLQSKGYIPDLDYEFLGNIHDEFQMEGRPELADEIGKTAVWAIQEAGRRLKVKVPLDGEYKVGDSWAECH